MRRVLVPHPDFPCPAVREISVEASRADARLSIRYSAKGTIGDLVVPPPAAPERTDDLWRHTCFEAFARAGGGPAYVEINLAPSGQWAAYRFDSARTGMAPAPVRPPALSFETSPERLVLSVVLDLSGVPELPSEAPWRLGLTSVIEEKGGRLSYWSLAHQPGRPDFHNPESFVLDLPPAERP